MSYMDDLKNLKNQIVVTRAKMNQLWERRGFTDADVLEVSIKLDRLINKYQQITFLNLKVK